MGRKINRKRLGRNKHIEHSLIYCLAYDRDSSRCKKVVRQAKKWGIHPVKTVTPKSGQLTKFRDHITLLENAEKRGATSCVIFEDCAHIIGPARISESPKDADLLFLGGEVEHVFEHTNDFWKKACVSSTFSYIVMKKAYKRVINFLRNCDYGTLSDAFVNMQQRQQEIDENKEGEVIKEKDFNLNSYVMYPQAVLHYKNMAMKELANTPKSLNNIPHEWVKIGGDEKTENSAKYMKFNLGYKNNEPKEDEPLTSIISIPSQKKWNYSLFPVLIRNFFMFNYPSEKLEWIIIDTADDDDLKNYMETICPGILDDERIKYKRVTSTNTIELNGNQKLNEAMKIVEVNSQYIINMAEAVYYTPDYVSFCVYVLNSPAAKASNIQCIGKTMVDYYDLGHQYCYRKHALDINGHDILLIDKTMAFSVDFWKERQFNDNQIGNIGYAFIMDRFDKIWNVPKDHFSLIGLSYGIRPHDAKEKANLTLISLLDQDTQEFIDVTSRTFKLN